MRAPVELHRSYRLLNHGPVVLVTAAAGGKTGIMPAAWVMPVDLAPPLLAIVLSEESHTRQLIDASDELALSLPPASMIDAVHGTGQVSGRDVDKWARFGLKPFPATRIAPPLVEGCLAWLECRVVDRALAKSMDLLVCEAVAAWAEDDVFQNGEWRFTDPDRRTIHHLSGGKFLLTGEPRAAREG